MMNRYLESAGLSCDSPFFCQRSKTKCGHKPRSKGLSYSRLRELVLEAFKFIVPDISAIGTHSLTSGGVTAAANAKLREFRRSNCELSFQTKKRRNFGASIVLMSAKSFIFIVLMSVEMQKFCISTLALTKSGCKNFA